MVDQSDSPDVSDNETEIQQREDTIDPDFPEDLSKLTKRELMDLIPDEIKESTSQTELKRLSKPELLALVDTTQAQE